MLYLVLVLILIAAASVATIYVIGEPGYIFLQWGSWQVETSLILVVSLIFLVVLLLYVLVELIGGIVGIPGRVGKSYREYREQKKLITTAKGFRHLLMGDWAKAEKLLEGAAKHLPEAAINHLAAAYAAQKRGNLGERDAYLIKAKEQGQEYQHVVSLVTCRLQMDQNEYSSAIEELKKLCSALPNNGVLPFELSLRRIRKPKTGLHWINCSRTCRSPKPIHPKNSECCLPVYCDIDCSWLTLPVNY